MAQLYEGEHYKVISERYNLQGVRYSVKFTGGKPLRNT